MSTKTSIFLTDDNDEHCYMDFLNPGVITMEISKKNITITNDPESDNIIIEFTNPESEIYKLVLQMTQKQQYGG